MAVHLNCYGLEGAPVGRFICSVCTTFEDPTKVPCQLCSVQGGIMRPTMSKIKDPAQPDKGFTFQKAKSSLSFFNQQKSSNQPLFILNSRPLHIPEKGKGLPVEGQKAKAGS